jgi:hypothetical protein
VIAYDVCGRHSSSLFLDSYEADFIQDFLEKIEKKLHVAHYIDTFLSEYGINREIYTPYAGVARM